MRRLFALAFILLAVAQANASPCVLALNSQLPVAPDGTIKAEFNNQSTSLELDTGVFSSVLTAAASERLHLERDPDHPIAVLSAIDDPYKVGRRQTANVLFAHQFALGRIHSNHFDIFSSDVDLGHADGLLSTDILYAYDIDLDWLGNEIRLFQASGDCHVAKLFLQPELYKVPLLIQPGYYTSPKIQIQINDNTLIALIDTGAATSAIYRNSAYRAGASSASLAADPSETIQGIGPHSTTATTHVFASLAIGDLTLRNTKLDVLDHDKIGDVDVILGRDFQRKFHLWISNSSHTLIVQYPPRPSPPIP